MLQFLSLPSGIYRIVHQYNRQNWIFCSFCVKCIFVNISERYVHTDNLWKVWKKFAESFLFYLPFCSKMRKNNNVKSSRLPANLNSHFPYIFKASKLTKPSKRLKRGYWEAKALIINKLSMKEKSMTFFILKTTCNRNIFLLWM